MPRCVLMLAYLAVPVKFLFSRYGMCWCVLASRYFLARPKSIMYTRFPFLPSPMRKLSGFMSRWIKFLEWMYSTRLIYNHIQWSRAHHELWHNKTIAWSTQRNVAIATRANAHHHTLKYNECTGQHFKGTVNLPALCALFVSANNQSISTVKPRQFPKTVQMCVTYKPG